MNTKPKKFEFPAKGFHIVGSKVGEADYFLGQLEKTKDEYEIFKYNLSAFASAARSISFHIQSVMRHYPGFNEWYEVRQNILKKNELAKFFLNLRNLTQKEDEPPVGFTGKMRNGVIRHHAFFWDYKNNEYRPIGDVVDLSKEYLITLLEITYECYRDFSVYVDPRAIFTKQGLAKLGWCIEDIEEAVGLPRGFTDIQNGVNNDDERLKLLQRDYQGDEVMEQYFDKYGLKQNRKKDD